MSKSLRAPLLFRLYQEYLDDQDSAAFSGKVCQRYDVGTLERLATAGDRMTRRAAVLALGLVADYDSNEILGPRFATPTEECACWPKMASASYGAASAAKPNDKPWRPQFGTMRRGAFNWRSNRRPG